MLVQITSWLNVAGCSRVRTLAEQSRHKKFRKSMPIGGVPGLSCTFGRPADTWCTRSKPKRLTSRACQRCLHTHPARASGFSVSGISVCHLVGQGNLGKIRTKPYLDPVTAQMKRAQTADHGNQASRFKLPPSFICSLAMLYLYLYSLRKTSHNKTN